MKDITLMEESLEAIAKLSDKDAGKLLKVLIRHTEGDEPTDLPLILSVVYPLVATQVDRIAAVREKRAEAGRKGGSKTEANAKQNEANVKQNEANAKQTLSPEPEPVPEPEPEPVPEPVPMPEPEHRETALKRSKEIVLPQSIDQDIVREALVDFRAMRAKLRKPLTPRAEELLIKDLIWKLK